jgi:outer membrane protein TolC
MPPVLMRFLVLLFVFFFCSFVNAETEAVKIFHLKNAESPLGNFAREIVSGNRNLLAASHELESAMLARHKALAVFSPRFSYAMERSKATNSDYNSLTGVEEDYTSRRSGISSSISQRTPLGRLSYDYFQSKTDYTSAQTSYFNSLYLTWQTGILRNDARLNSLERKMAHADYDISLAQTDSILLDILLGSFQTLFNRMIVARNESLKKQNLSFYSTLVEEAEIKLKNGMGSELDLKQASMRYRQAETEHDETELSLREQDRRIGSQLGHLNWNRELASFSLDPLIEAIPEIIATESLYATAFQSRPDFRLIENQYELRKAAFRRARELSRPDLSARLRWGKQGRSFDKGTAADMDDKSWDVAITYSTSLGPNDEKIDFSMQKETLKAFEARLAQKRDEIKIAVSQAFERLMFYRKNLDSLKASEKLAAEVLEGQRLNFQLGKISLLDLTRYQQDFNNASIAVVQGESRLIMSWLELLFETGILAGYLEVKQSSQELAGINQQKYEIIPLDETDQ